MEDTTGYHAEDRSSDQGSDLRKDDAWRADQSYSRADDVPDNEQRIESNDEVEAEEQAIAPENRESGPARDYGPQGLGDPGYGQWNYRLGNYDYGFAGNYGRGQDNAYNDPAYFGESEQESPSAADIDAGALRQARRLLEPREGPGPLSGKGPRGYNRSAERILEDLNDRLTDHGDIDATKIDISVVNEGEVRLEGSVGSRREKHLAEDIAASVPGVRQVHNRLQVHKGEQTDPG